MYEPDVQWNLRKAFIKKNEGKMDRIKLLRMSDNLVNMGNMSNWQHWRKS
jgi:hypothetical protein